MEMDKLELNKAYYQLHLKSTELASGLFHRIFEIESGWYHGKHLTNADGQTYMSHFPLSVVSVKGYCDVEVDFDEIIVYTKLSRKTAMQYSFEKFKDYPFEAYGTDDYYTNLHPYEATIDEFHKALRNCDEKEIEFRFRFDYSVTGEQMYEFIKLLRREQFYY